MTDRNLARVVDVSVSVRGGGPQQASFSSLLLVSPVAVAAYGADRIRSYASLDDVAVDHDVDGWVYSTAAAIFAQTPTVRSIKVGVPLAGQLPTVGHTITVTADTTGHTFDASAWSGTLHSWSQLVSGALIDADTVTTIAAEIAASLVALGHAATSSVGVVTVAPTHTEPVRLQRRTANDRALLVVADTSTWSELGTLLTALREIDSDWVAVAVPFCTGSIVTALTAWCSAARVIALIDYSSSDALGSGTSDALYALVTSSVEFAFAPYYGVVTHSGFAAALLANRLAATEPGGSSFFGKTLVGFEADRLTNTEIDRVALRNSTCYIVVGGVSATFPPSTGGKVPSGEWADIVLGKLWLDQRIREAYWAAVLATDKADFTDTGGGALIYAAIMGVLRQGVTNRLLSDTDEEPRVYVPPASSLTSANRAARHWPGITYSARLAGAVHSVSIKGTVIV